MTKMSITYSRNNICAVTILLLNFAAISHTLSETQKREILDIHNKYRNNLGWKDRTGTRFSGQAQNMRVLNWDSRLEETAEEVAGLCRRTHTGLYGPRVGLLENEIGPIGENLYFADGFSEDRNVVALVNKWYSEVHKYEWENHSCRDDVHCLNFTQMIWADSEILGCAQARCEDSEQTEVWTKFVCHYGPTGNVFNQVPFQSAPNSDADNICTEPGLVIDEVYPKCCSEI